MGIRVSLDLGAPDGLEGFFWETDPRLYRDWARSIEEEYPGSISSELLCRLDRIVTEGPSSLIPADPHDAAIIDMAFDEFIGYYFDYHEPAASLLREASGSVVNVRWYHEVQPRIDARCSRETSLCWKHLLEGRAVGRPPDSYSYTPNDEVFRLGYWTADEVRIVHDDLRAAFPEVVRRIEGSEEKPRRRFAFFARKPDPDDDLAIRIVLDATAKALSEETGLITVVA